MKTFLPWSATPQPPEHQPAEDAQSIHRAAVREIMYSLALPEDRAHIVHHILYASRRCPPVVTPAAAIAVTERWGDVLVALNQAGHRRSAARRWPFDVRRLRCPWHQEHHRGVFLNAFASGPLLRNDFRVHFMCFDIACRNRGGLDLERWARAWHMAAAVTRAARRGAL